MLTGVSWSNERSDSGYWYFSSSAWKRGWSRRGSETEISGSVLGIAQGRRSQRLRIEHPAALDHPSDGLGIPGCHFLGSARSTSGVKGFSPRRSASIHP